MSRRSSREEDAGNEEDCINSFRALREYADSDSEEEPLPGGYSRKFREKTMMTRREAKLLAKKKTTQLLGNLF